MVCHGQTCRAIIEIAAQNRKGRDTMMPARTAIRDTHSGRVPRVSRAEEADGERRGVVDMPFERQNEGEERS